MEIHLEQPTTEDVAELLDLAKTTFCDAFEHLNAPADFAAHLAETFTVERFLAELADPMSEYWWARKDGLPVGFIKLNKGRTHDAFEVLLKTDGRLCELQRIYVRTDQKRLGIGQKLMDLALERARLDDSDWLWLGVFEANERAIQFYTAQGFEVFGRHFFDIGRDRQVDLLMRKAVA